MRLLPISALALLCALGLSATAKAEPKTSIDSLVDRITWGRTSEAVASARSQGADRWLRGQLHPAAATLPPSVKIQIDAMRVSHTPVTQLAVEMEAQAKAAANLQDLAARQAAQQAHQNVMNDLKQQAAARSLLRDLYSSNQLQEQMTWFWFNHFNVQADKRDIRAMVGDYEDQAIRPHALGKFRDLLKAADLHPAMLRYLDNDQNAAGHRRQLSRSFQGRGR